MLDLWDLLVEENGVPGSVGEHLSRAVTAGRELLATVVEQSDQTGAVVGAQGEAGPANPPDAGPAKPRPPRANRSKQGTL